MVASPMPAQRPHVPPDQGSGYGVGTLWNQCDCICPWNAEYTKQFERIAEKGSIPFKMPPGGVPGMPGYQGPDLYNGQSVIVDRPVANLDEVAAALVYLASEESRYLTGDCLDMNGGILMAT